MTVGSARRSPGQVSTALRASGLGPGLTCLLLGLLAAAALAGEKETENYVLYEPKGAVRGMAVCFSPVGDARAAMAPIRPYADRFGLLVVGSKQFRNGPNDMPGIAGALDREVIQVYHPDPGRSFATGLSGGGQFAYSFLNYRPDWLAGVIVNTCRINPDDKKRRWVSGKYAVMLASPPDFRYAEMKEDRQFLDKAGWRTTWLEFPQGHTYAPAGTYARAVTGLKL